MMHPLYSFKGTILPGQRVRIVSFLTGAELYSGSFSRIGNVFIEGECNAEVTMIFCGTDGVLTLSVL